MHYGAAYYPEHRSPDCWTGDCDLMKDAYVSAVRVGEFSWSRFEPQSGSFDWEWLDRFLSIANERGISVLLCPPLRTPPQWLVEEHPDIMIERADGKRLTFGGRYRYCINNPALREAGERLAAAMASRYGKDKRIIGWHLDNEHGCEEDCHCPVCTALFRAWCRERYGTIEQLNDAWGLAFWGLQFTSFDSIATPRGEYAGDGPGHGIAWRWFRSDCTIGAVALQASAVRKHAPQPVTTNNQPLWNFRTDYPLMAKHLDQCGTNYYPPLSGDTRAIALGLTAARCYRGPRQTFQLHELRNAPHMVAGRGGDENRAQPGAVERLALHVVANGADAIYFFRWDACPFGHEQNHGTIQGFDGKPRRVYPEVQKAGANLKRLWPLIQDSHVPSEVALFYDFPTRWDVERVAPFTGGQNVYLDMCKRIHRAARGQGYCVDTCDRHGDWSAYRVVIVPQLSCCDDALAGKILSFVNSGGRLVWHPLCAMKNIDGTIFPERVHPALTGMLGCRIQECEMANAEDVPFTWNGRRWNGGYFADLAGGLADDEIEGRYEEGWIKGMPAVIRRAVGRGHLHYCTTFAEEAFHAEWLPQICAAAGVGRILPDAPPPMIELCERRRADGTRLIFVLNQSDEEQRIALPDAEDVYRQERVNGETILPPRSIRILHLPAGPGLNV